MPEAIANPAVVGSDVRDVAALIESKGLLEQSLTIDGEPPEKQAPEEAPEPEESPERELETPAEDQAGDASPEAEAEPEPQEELPDTLDGLAEAVGLSADEFADHVHVPVTVNGETRMVTLAEARKGYQMEADYRSKTSDLAESKRVFETQTQQAVQAWQQRFESLDGLTGQLEKAVQEDTGNLESILNEQGSEAFLAAKLRVDQNKELLAHAKAEREKAALETQEGQRVEYERYKGEQFSLLVQALPEMGHPEKGQKLNIRLEAEAIERGYSQQEIAQFGVNHRHVLALYDAMRYRELQKAKPSTVKKLKALPKVVKPGAKPEKDDIARSKAVVNLQRLKKSGSREDAALTIEDLL